MSESLQSESISALVSSPHVNNADFPDSSTALGVDEEDTQPVDKFGGDEDVNEGAFQLLVTPEGVEGNLKVDFLVIKVKDDVGNKFLLTKITGIF